MWRFQGHVSEPGSKCAPAKAHLGTEQASGQPSAAGGGGGPRAPREAPGAGAGGWKPRAAPAVRAGHRPHGPQEPRDRGRMKDLPPRVGGPGHSAAARALPGPSGDAAVSPHRRAGAWKRELCGHRSGTVRAPVDRTPGDLRFPALFGRISSRKDRI